MEKGAKTRADIVRAATGMASKWGLVAVSIGGLAAEAGMSKSGLFAHFGSKEKLQLAILESARERFMDQVIRPAIKIKRGRERILALSGLWLEWERASAQGGCVFQAAAADFASRPGPVRDYLWKTQKEWTDFLAKAARLAVEAGDFRKDTDDSQFAYELQSLTLGYSFHKRLLGDKKAMEKHMKAVEGLLDRYSK